MRGVEQSRDVHIEVELAIVRVVASLLFDVREAGQYVNRTLG